MACALYSIGDGDAASGQELENEGVDFVAGFGDVDED